MNSFRVFSVHAKILLVYIEKCLMRLAKKKKFSLLSSHGRLGHEEIQRKRPRGSLSINIFRGNIREIQRQHGGGGGG
jgi:hypothetical protein